MASSIKTLAFAIGLVAAAPLCGCSVESGSGRWEDACQFLGLCDPPPPTPVLVDVACGATPATACEGPLVRSTLTAVLRRVVELPHSHVRLWKVAETAEATQLIVEVERPAAPKSAKARRAEGDHWQATTLELLVSRASCGHEVRQPTATPLADLLTKVALADGHGLARELVVVTDGHETVRADFTCDEALPTEMSWLTRLHRNRLLESGSLDGVAVSFVHLGATVKHRCPVSLKREQHIRELWQASLTHAGAREVRFLSGEITYPATTGKEERP